MNKPPGVTSIEDVRNRFKKREPVFSPQAGEVSVPATPLPPTREKDSSGRWRHAKHRPTVNTAGIVSTDVRSRAACWSCRSLVVGIEDDDVHCAPMRLDTLIGTEVVGRCPEYNPIFNFEKNYPKEECAKDLHRHLIMGLWAHHKDRLGVSADDFKKSSRIFVASELSHLDKKYALAFLNKDLVAGGFETRGFALNDIIHLVNCKVNLAFKVAGARALPLHVILESR